MATVTHDGMDERRLTFIIVPHGHLETRTYEISYRRLRFALFGVMILLVAFVVMVASWWYVAAQAARVPGLEREIATLEAEREQVAEFASLLAEVESQYERVRKLLGADTPPDDGRDPMLPPLRPEPRGVAMADGAASTPTAWPLTQPGFITRELTKDKGMPHPGIDIAVPQDTYIRASGSGIVQAAGMDSIYGHFVLIRHPDGHESMYGHASQVFVAVGDTVESHEVIALSGSTGRSTAPHLHFEIRKDGKTVDPLTMIRKP